MHFGKGGMVVYKIFINIYMHIYAYVRNLKFKGTSKKGGFMRTLMFVLLVIQRYKMFFLYI